MRIAGLKVRAGTAPRRSLALASYRPRRRPYARNDQHYGDRRLTGMPKLPEKVQARTKRASSASAATVKTPITNAR